MSTYCFIITFWVWFRVWGRHEGFVRIYCLHPQGTESTGWKTPHGDSTRLQTGGLHCYIAINCSGGRAPRHQTPLGMYEHVSFRHQLSSTDNTSYIYVYIMMKLNIHKPNKSSTTKPEKSNRHSQSLVNAQHRLALATLRYTENVHTGSLLAIYHPKTRTHIQRQRG